LELTVIFQNRATASVNLYGMYRKDKALLGLVDLPGFGYAKLSKETKESVQEAAENYLGNRKELMLGILLVDIRRVPSDDDRAVLAALFDMGVPIVVVATKVDKLSKTQEEESLLVIQEGLGLPEGQPYSLSSTTGQGIKGLWRIIMEACEGGVAELNAKLEQGGDIDVPFSQEEYIEDGEDVAYSQGFDWVHDSNSVMYEDDGYLKEDVEEFDEEFDGYYDDEDSSAPVVEEKQTLKFLRKKAKDMERRGEL
jgi:GTP-binding protein